MAARSGDIVGLEINSSFVRAVELKKTIRGLRVDKVETVPMPLEVFKEGKITKEDLIVHTLQELVRNANLKTKLVSLVLPEDAVITRIIKIPEMPVREIREVVRGEVEQYGLFPILEAVFDFCILERFTEEGIKKVNVFFAFTHKEILEIYARMLEKAGLQLSFTNLTLQAALRNIDVSVFKQQELTGLMIITEEAIKISAFKGNIPSIIRTIETGQKLSAITHEQVERKELNPVMIELLDEIRRSLDYFQENLPGMPAIKKMFIVADEERFQGLRNFIQEGLGIEVNFAPAASLSLGIGAAKIGKQKTVLDPINLLIPSSQKKSFVSIKDIIIAVSSFVAAIIVFAMLGAMLQDRINFLKKEMLSQEEELKKVESLGIITRDDIGWVKIEKSLKSKIGAAKNENTPPVSGVFEELARIVPENVWVTSVSTSGKPLKINISGVGLSHKAINQFVKALQQSPKFASVVLSSTSLDNIAGRAVMRFTIEFDAP